MQYTSEFCAGTLKNNDVSHYEEALSRVIRSAQQSANCEGFWRNYIRLERIYNAVEVWFICVFFFCGFLYYIFDFGFFLIDSFFLCLGDVHYSHHCQEQY